MGCITFGQQLTHKIKLLWAGFWCRTKVVMLMHCSTRRDNYGELLSIWTVSWNKKFCTFMQENKITNISSLSDKSSPYFRMKIKCLNVFLYYEIAEIINVFENVWTSTLSTLIAMCLCLCLLQYKRVSLSSIRTIILMYAKFINQSSPNLLSSFVWIITK